MEAKPVSNLSTVFVQSPQMMHTAARLSDVFFQFRWRKTLSEWPAWFCCCKVTVMQVQCLNAHLTSCSCRYPSTKHFTQVLYKVLTAMCSKLIFGLSPGSHVLHSKATAEQEHCHMGLMQHAELEQWCNRVVSGQSVDGEQIYTCTP